MGKWENDLDFCLAGHVRPTAGITFFPKLSKKMKSKKMRFLRKYLSKKIYALSKKMDLGDFFSSERDRD